MLSEKYTSLQGPLKLGLLCKLIAARDHLKNSININQSSLDQSSDNLNPTNHESHSSEIKPLPIRILREKYDAHVDNIAELKIHFPQHFNELQILVGKLNKLGDRYYQWLSQKADKCMDSSQGNESRITDATEADSYSQDAVSLNSDADVKESMSAEEFKRQFKTIVEDAKKTFAKTPGLWESLSPEFQSIAKWTFIPYLLIKVYDMGRAAAINLGLFKPEPLPVMMFWEAWQLDMLPEFESPAKKNTN